MSSVEKFLDFAKVQRVVRSCKTSAQNNNACRMVILFDRKWNDKFLLDTLCDYVEENLLEICS